jgi:L-asparagine oxygenase
VNKGGDSCFSGQTFSMQQTLLEPDTLPHWTLPERNRRAWLAEASRLQFPDPHDLNAWRSFVQDSIAFAQRHLPDEIAAALDRFFSPGGPDALMLEGLPVDTVLPPAPKDGKRPAAKTAVSEAVIAGLVEAHATILAFSNEKAGAPIHEITPVAGLEHVPSSSGRVAFAYHTDVAFLAPRFSPRGMILFGLRNPESGPTSMLLLEHVVEAAPPSLLRSLEKPIFRHPAPASFELKVSHLAPIIWRDERGVAHIAVQTHAVQAAEGPAQAEAEAALAEFRALLASLDAHRVVLGPGDALLFKNDRVLHGRDAFAGERWLQRAYFTDSAERFREHTGSEASQFAFDARRLLSREVLDSPLVSVQ